MAERVVTILTDYNPAIVNHDAVWISVAEQDTVTWECADTDFEIVEFRLDEGGKKGKKVNPFFLPLPFKSSEARKANSGPAMPNPEYIGRIFHTEILVKRTPKPETIDPHIGIGR